jgi:hypothetical protein
MVNKSTICRVNGGGRLLTGSEEDGGFGSLSGCDLDGDSLQGGRKEVSAAAEGSEDAAAWHGLPNGGDGDFGPELSEWWRGERTAMVGAEGAAATRSSAGEEAA